MRKPPAPDSGITRRRLIGLGVTGLVAAVATPLASACQISRGEAPPEETGDGRLSTRPGTPTIAPTIGLTPLGLSTVRDGTLYVPSSYKAGTPAPMMLMLHGAGGAGSRWLAPFTAMADQYGVVLLAPDSRQPTWDVIRAQYGPDVAFIDKALKHVFDRVQVDTTRLIVQGFSDGASYALSLGITNGDLFTRIVAFSPGFMAPSARNGNPRIFVSHGTNDQILPIASCSRVIVPALRRNGYTVDYREFDGPHAVPNDIAAAAAEWMTAT